MILREIKEGVKHFIKQSKKDAYPAAPNYSLLKRVWLSAKWSWHSFWSTGLMSKPLRWELNKFINRRKNT